ncbi:hypothetical protein [Aquimarina sp. BL5]|uniref:hypothetical protein n=1 Tax=Aquimarina sp. BL5 TaxID=1714860 RepID=UPI0011C3F4E4|nr:hypothetical protein [Aquimarina sp. BL5]
MHQHIKHKKIILPLLVIYFLFGCKQPKKDVVIDVSSNINDSIPKKTQVKDNNPKCFSTNDIEKISNHYKKLEEVIKSGVEYDFTNSPVEYSDKDILWLKRTLKRSICKGEIKRVKDDDDSCPKSILYNIDCSETIVIDGEENFSEQDYWDILVKKNGKVIISKSGGAG